MDYLEFCKNLHTENNVEKLHEVLSSMPQILKNIGVTATEASPFSVKGFAENENPHCDVAFELSVEDASLTMLFTSKIYRGVSIDKEGELVDLLNELNRGLFGGAFYFSMDDQSVLYRSTLFVCGDVSEQNALYFVADSIACTSDFGTLINDFLRGNLSFEDCMDLLNGVDPEEETGNSDFN